MSEPEKPDPKPARSEWEEEQNQQAHSEAIVRGDLRSAQFHAWMWSRVRRLAEIEGRPIP